MWSMPLLEFVSWMSTSDIVGIAAGLELFCVLFAKTSQTSIVVLIPQMMPVLFQMFASPDVKDFIIYC